MLQVSNDGSWWLKFGYGRVEARGRKKTCSLTAAAEKTVPRRVLWKFRWFCSRTAPWGGPSTESQQYKAKNMSEQSLDLFRMVKSPETSMDDFRNVQQIRFSKRLQSVAQTSDWILFSLELKLLHQRSVIKDLKQTGWKSLWWLTSEGPAAILTLPEGQPGQRKFRGQRKYPIKWKMKSARIP